jgi:hypothetical protein
MEYLLGRPKLSDKPMYFSPLEDLFAFLGQCADAHFLDFVETIFQVSCYWRICDTEDQMVDEINHFFSIDDLNYALTPFVREERIEPSFVPPKKYSELVAYPRIIRKDAEILYQHAIKPAIDLLGEKGFSAANIEFLDALTHFRRGEFGDCLTKCGSAFESTLKTICSRQKWPFTPSDTAAPLLHTVMQKSSLDGFFEQPLILVATIRNRLSTAHGAGNTPKHVSPHIAQFAINTTAAAILILVTECLYLTRR